MAPVDIARICTSLCFNMIYLFTTISFAVTAITYSVIRKEVIRKKPSYIENSTFTVLISLNWFITVFTFFVAIFGFVAFFVNKKPNLFLTLTNEILKDKSSHEVLKGSLALTLTDFKFVPSKMQNAIQEFQQKNDCCGYGSYYDFFFIESEPNPRSRIPNSCCGMYEAGSNRTMGDCSYDEYWKRPGCGDPLVDFFGSLTQKTGLIILVPFYITQAVAIGSSLYISRNNFIPF